jgi:ribose/xylose/arabinose/galactoside ABC-type transport system permease subunit
MPPMLATIAMGTIISGISYILCDGYPIYKVPEAFKVFGQGSLGPIPWPVIIMAIIFVGSTFIMSRTYIGRYIYAAGSNEEAARLSGLNTNRIRLFVYSISGFLAGIAGIIMASRVASGQPSAGSGFEMDALTAAVVGGVGIGGGEGKIYGALLGVLLIGVLSNGLVILGLNEYIQMVTKGTVLMLAVGFDSMQRARK